LVNPDRPFIKERIFMANRYDVRNLHGLGGRSEEFQTAMDLIEADIAAKAGSSDTTTALGTKVKVTTTPTALVLSATTGTLPTAASTQVFSDAATPTVAELLAAVVSLNAKVEALRTALRTAS